MTNLAAYQNVVLDEEQVKLQATFTKTKEELDKAIAKKERLQREISQGDPDEDGDLAKLERKIILFTNEVTILDCTLNIYDLTYKPGKTDMDKQMLYDLWHELEQTFQTDKMKKHLEHLLPQLKEDPAAYKQKAI